METTNHEHRVSLEVAKLLKEAGFDWECRKIYYNYPENTDNWSLVDNYMNHHHILHVDFALLSPTLDVAQRWLREVKHLNISVSYDPTIKQQPYVYFIYDIDGVYGDIFGGISPITHYTSDGYFYTYEEAQELGIKEALKIILEKGEKNWQQYTC